MPALATGVAAALLAFALSSEATASGAGAHDTGKAAAALPDPFRFKNGTHVHTRDDWNRRRAEIVDTLSEYEYGHMPPAPDRIEVERVFASPALDGKATEIRVAIKLGPEGQLRMQGGLFVPAGQGPFPAVLSIDPVWDPGLKDTARLMVERGYIFAGFEKHDIERDDEGRTDGLQPLYPDYDWATLSVWAWGAMRMMDYLVTRPDVDQAHVAVTGHSRCGKTALWAGALDTRFALVAPHASGAGGAGCFRIMNKDSETLALITAPDRFHYWFAPRLSWYAHREDQLPFDQHLAKALVAPRALLSMEGLGDKWANPLGSQVTTQAAQPVFDWLGAGDRNAVYFREGGHDTTLEDWRALLDYADRVFFGKTTGTVFNKMPFPSYEIPKTWRVPKQSR